MNWPLMRITLLALVSILGIGGMLLADGIWDWLFLGLAALPLLLGAAMLLVRRLKASIRDWCDTQTVADWE